MSRLLFPQHVRDQLNRGVVPENTDVHCLFALIKACFRELPCGVLDCISPEEVLNCNTKEESVYLIKQLKPTESTFLRWEGYSPSYSSNSQTDSDPDNAQDMEVRRTNKKWLLESAQWLLEAMTVYFKSASTGSSNNHICLQLSLYLLQRTNKKEENMLCL